MKLAKWAAFFSFLSLLLACPGNRDGAGECHSDGGKAVPFRGKKSCPEGKICNFFLQTCVVPKSLAAGASCKGTLENADNVCSAGLICNSVSGLCDTPKQAGGICRRKIECVTGMQCNSGYETWANGRVGDGPPAGQCHPQSATGSRCGTRDDCVEGLVCSSVTSPRQCQPFGKQGEKCDDMSCESSLVCDVSLPRGQWQCINLNSKGVGEPCLGKNICKEGLKCLQDMDIFKNGGGAADFCRTP